MLCGISIVRARPRCRLDWSRTWHCDERRRIKSRKPRRVVSGAAIRTNFTTPREPSERRCCRIKRILTRLHVGGGAVVGAGRRLGAAAGARQQSERRRHEQHPAAGGRRRFHSASMFQFKNNHLQHKKKHSNWVLFFNFYYFTFNFKPPNSKQTSPVTRARSQGGTWTWTNQTKHCFTSKLPTLNLSSSSYNKLDPKAYRAFLFHRKPSTWLNFEQSQPNLSTSWTLENFVNP